MKALALLAWLLGASPAWSANAIIECVLPDGSRYFTDTGPCPAGSRPAAPKKRESIGAPLSSPEKPTAHASQRHPSHTAASGRARHEDASGSKTRADPWERPDFPAPPPL
ncbi:MAG: hypothetical protein D6771_07205 [Zetaproteobacteria bacterium]|nr:MAG: hypothetical protein D6771_07205 [Zetaproteobacteria bacterium]